MVKENEEREGDWKDIKVMKVVTDASRRRSWESEEWPRGGDQDELAR